MSAGSFCRSASIVTTPLAARQVEARRERRQPQLGLAMMTMKVVTWNSQQAAVGPVRDVADHGDDVTVLADQGLLFFSNGLLTGKDPDRRGLQRVGQCQQGRLQRPGVPVVAPQRQAAGITQGMIRVAVGLDDVRDLQADLLRGLSTL